MSARVRHQSAPVPSGCRWCGDEPGHHGHRWVASIGMHQWAEPTREQRLARMKARFTTTQGSTATLDERVAALRARLEGVQIAVPADGIELGMLSAQAALRDSGHTPPAPPRPEEPAPGERA